MDYIRQMIEKLKGFVNIIQFNTPTPKGQKIYETALQCIGIDASPNDLAPDELGCAETVTTILNKAGIQMPVILSTAELFKYLSAGIQWLEVPKPLPGDVIISPTGMGGKNGITHGHTGIMGLDGKIMSNNSYTGTFEKNYTIQSWKARYQNLGGYPVHIFRKV